jgi:hypothetical protein
LERVSGRQRSHSFKGLGSPCPTLRRRTDRTGSVTWQWKPYRQHPTGSSAEQLGEISRVRKQRITYLPLDGIKRQTQRVLSLEISLRAFSQALLVTPDDFQSEGFPRWANEEEHETLFQKTDSQQMAAKTAWVRLLLREASKRCHDIIALLDEPGMTVKEAVRQISVCRKTKVARRLAQCGGHAIVLPSTFGRRRDMSNSHLVFKVAGREPLHITAYNVASNSNLIKEMTKRKTKRKNRFMIASV